MDNMNDHSKLEVKQKQIAQRIANSLLKGANVPFSLEKRDLVARITMEIAPSYITNVAISKMNKKNSSMGHGKTRILPGAKELSVSKNGEPFLRIGPKTYQSRGYYVGETRATWQQKRGPRVINAVKLRKFQSSDPVMAYSSIGMVDDMLQFDNDEGLMDIPKSWKISKRDELKKKIMKFIGASKYGSIKELADYLGVNPITISRMWSADEGRIELKIVVSVCIALKIPIRVAAGIIMEEGYCFRNTPTERMYEVLLNICKNGDVSKCNELLDALGCDLLPCAKPKESKED